MPRVGFDLTIPVFERAKTVDASDFAATVIGAIFSLFSIKPFVFRNNSLGLVMIYGPGGQDSVPGKSKDLFSTAFALVLRSTQPALQWVPGTLSLEIKQLGSEAITDLYLVPR
jgi:hypothetical protein